jgi:hypothetical protein
MNTVNKFVNLKFIIKGVLISAPLELFRTVECLINSLIGLQSLVTSPPGLTVC